MEKTVIVSAEAVSKLTPFDELIDIIEEAFVAYTNQCVEMPPKTYVPVAEHNGDFRSMPTYINASDWEAAGMKWVNVHPDNVDLPTVMGVVVYSDPETGYPLALLNGTELTARRTAAAAGLATKYLAPDDATTLGVIGAGAQAYTQVEAISTVRNIESITVSELDDVRRQEFVETYQNEYQITTGSPDEAASEDIVSTLTPVTEPIVNSLGENTHLNSMGADAPHKQELNPQILTNDQTSVFVDDWEQALHSGEVSQAYESGALSRDEISGTLGDVVVGNNLPETLTDTATVFDSTGLAVQDIAAAHLVYENSDLSDASLRVNLL